MANENQGFSRLIEELKRTVGLLENRVESRTIDGYITLDELDVSKELRAKLKEIDRNGDGKLTLDELQSALKKGLKGDLGRVVTDARNAVNNEIMQMYSEALDKFVEYKTRLELAHVNGVEHYKIPELLERSEKLHEQINQTLQVMKKKPEIMNALKGEIRDFMRDVRDVEKAAGG
jgi:hypothetical protein